MMKREDGRRGEGRVAVDEEDGLMDHSAFLFYENEYKWQWLMDWGGG